MLHLVLRSLAHYRRSALAAACGVALATAVVTGSLLVGDSVRGSLRERALSRLGRASWAMTAPGFFRADLADDLLAAPLLNPRLRAAASLMLAAGSARNASTDAVAPAVTLVGLGADFRAFGPVAPPPAGHAAVSRSLADDLGLRVGDDLLFTVGRPRSAPGMSLFASAALEDATRTARVTLDRILPDRGIGGFSLAPGISAPRNVFVDRNWLAERLGRPGMANAIVLDADPRHDTLLGASLDTVLRQVCRTQDVGLRFEREPRGWMIRGERLVLPDSVVAAARETAERIRCEVVPSSVYLATALLDRRTGRSAAYAVLAATEEPAGPTAVRPGEIVLNRWAADDLGARVGDTIGVETLEPEWDGAYRSRSQSLRLARILEMRGPGADSGLPPDFEGITNAKRMGDWNPPFPIDRTRITPRDEEYWKRYRAAPRAYLNPAVLRALWRSGASVLGDDWVTGIRVLRSERTWAAPIEKILPHRLSPADLGLVFRPVRRMALLAAEGSSDFSALFAGMGFFLVAAGAWMAGSLMRLLAERRARETGVMLACGFTPAETARLALAEGAIVAAIGAPVGGALGMAYGALICHGLGTWWSAALGGEPMQYHWTVRSMLGGVACGFGVGLLATAVKSRELPGQPVLRLLSGWVASSTEEQGNPIRPAAALAALLAGSALLAATGARQGLAAAAAFFGIGALLLLASLPACSLALMAAHRRRPPYPSLGLLAMRNAAVQRGHSLLAFGLTGCAAFVLVTVAANVRDFSRSDVHARDSGTGGFALIATSTLPIPVDFGSPAGRARLGFSPDDEAAFQGVSVVPFLLSPGDDASCLNPARPVAPRILGVPEAMVLRGGFRVATAGGSNPSNPWRRLDAPVRRGVVPAFADAESAEWILKSGLGQVYMARAGAAPLAVRFDGLVASSIFAGEILISEKQFRRAFPSVREPAYFLIDTPPGRESTVASALRRNLGDRGLEVRTTREKLNALIGVQNAYLSAFLALGGLGLALGTLGLAAALARSAQARRKEFATMLALGFTPGQIARGLVAEHSALLLAGMLWGAAAALLAVAPHLRSAEAAPNWTATAVLLTFVFVSGVGGCVWASRAAIRGELLAALRSE